ncbi:hypothetical protein WA026_021307, partial [Henosepilachna vigintioctopunctata]
ILFTLLNTFDSENYRKLTNKLDENGRSSHSYENKQSRPIRVIAKRLHHACDAKEIIGDHQGRDYKAIDACVKLKWKTKEPLNMFTSTVSYDEDINKIYLITTIRENKVEIEPIKKNPT